MARRKSKAMKPIKPSRNVTRRYAKGMRELIKLTKDKLIIEYNARSLEDFGNSIETIYNNMFWWQQARDKNQTLVEAMNIDNANKFNKSLSEAVGVDAGVFINQQGLEGVMTSAIEFSVNQYNDLEAQSMARVQRTVERALVTGRSKDRSLQSELVHDLGIDFKRAKFIARDTTQRVNNMLTKSRMEGAGIKQYRWSNSKDGRVRDSHRVAGNKNANGKPRGLGNVWRVDEIVKVEVNGKTETVVHPGFDYNCRCVAIPIVTF